MRRAGAHAVNAALRSLVAACLVIAGLAVPVTAFLTLGCSPESANPGANAGAVNSDETSRTEPQGEVVRLATLLPYVAEAVEGLAGVELVASVARRTGGPIAGGGVPEGIADLGSPHSPNFESLAASGADLVVADARLHGAFADKLGRAGAEVVLVEASSVDKTFDGLLKVGEACGAGDEMARRVEQARRAIEELRADRAAAVLPLFGAPGSFLAVTGSTWLGDLVAELGLTNLAQEATGREAFPGYVDLSEETLLTLEPERVLLVAHGSPQVVAEAFERERASGGAWGNLKGELVVLDPELFGGNPGLRMPEAARVLAEAVGAKATVAAFPIPAAMPEDAVLAEATSL